MPKRTWADGDHHWFDEPTRRGKPYMEEAYMKGTEHVQAHQDTREVGPTGAIARYERNRIMVGEGFLMFCEKA